MNESQTSLMKDTLIIIFIFVVISIVVFIFSTEIIKNNKIRTAKNNFFIIKEEITKEVVKCRDTEKDWIFGGRCFEKPTKKNISKYFNNTKKIVNPYDNLKGVEGAPGSILITLKNNTILMSVDIDANGGMDIEHKINFN